MENIETKRWQSSTQAVNCMQNAAIESKIVSLNAYAYHAMFLKKLQERAALRKKSLNATQNSIPNFLLKKQDKLTENTEIPRNIKIESESLNGDHQQNPNPLPRFAINRLKLMAATENCKINEKSVAETAIDTEQSGFVNRQLIDAVSVDVDKLEQAEVSGLISKIATGRIVAHGASPIVPINSVSEAFFTVEVHEGLKRLNLQELYISQAYAWPNLTRNNSMVLVDSKNRGKTIAYLPAICSLVQNYVESGRMEDRIGPLAIILCPNSTSVQYIGYLCKELLRFRNNSYNGVVEAIGNRNMDNVLCKLYNGSYILVTTAPCLYQLVKKNNYIIQVCALKHFIFENLDQILDQHKDKCKEIIKLFCNKSAQTRNGLQVVVTSHYWTPFVKQFCLEFITNPLLLIGNSLEAAMYGNMHISLEFATSDKKAQHILDYLKKIPIKTENTMVICSHDAEVTEIVKLLQTKNIDYELFGVVKSRTEDLLKLNAFWSQKGGVVICTDASLRDLRVNNAQHVIHVSMPDSYLEFLRRFSTSIGHYQNRLLNAIDDPGHNTSALVLVDECSNKQLPKVVDLLIRDGQRVPEDFLMISQQIRFESDQERTADNQMEPICNYVFMHGRKDHPAKCGRRHILTQADAVMQDCVQLPCNGMVRLHIFRIESPTHYTVRLLEVKPPNQSKWAVFNRANDFLSFSIEFNAYYENENNHRTIMSMELGEMGVAIIEQKPYRCRLIRKYETRKMAISNEYNVDVRLIDNGQIVRLKSTEIIALAEHFRDFPPQAVDLHLVGVIPGDLEDEWDPETTGHIEHLIDNLRTVEEVVRIEANVLFSLRNALVVDMLRVVNNFNSVSGSMKEFLISKRFGVPSKENRDKVLKMVRDLGIIGDSKSQNTPTNEESGCEKRKQEEEEVKEDENNNVVGETSMVLHETSQINEEYERVPKEEWASMRSKYEHICISTFYNPDNFYIQIVSDELLRLYEKIDAYAEEQQNVNIAVDTLKAGSYCLARFDGYWNRAKILAHLYGGDAFYVNVFCLDIGRFVVCKVNDISPICQQLIDALPFQAIWCKLYGIQPLQSEKGNFDVSDAIYDEIDAFSSNLCAKLVAIDNEAESHIFGSPIKCHSILLRGIDDGAYVNLNKRLIEKKFVEPEPDTQLDKENGEYGDAVESTHSNKALLAQSDEESTFDTEFDQYDVVDADLLLGHFYPSYKPISSTECNKQVVASEPLIAQNASETTQALQSDDNGFKAIPGPRIKNVYKAPEVKWHQSSEWIILQISAGDRVKYSLKVTSASLIYNAKVNESDHSVVINFFGGIEPKRTCHEIRGLNVMVKLWKCERHFSWPRLTKQDERNNWLQYDMSKLDLASDDFDVLNPNECLDAALMNDGLPDYTDDSDSDAGSYDDACVYLRSRN